MERVKRITGSLLRFGAVVCCVALLSGCSFRLWMYDQPKAQYQERNTFFADERVLRPEVEGAVAVGDVQTDEYFYTGLIDGEEQDTLPVELTAELLERGQEQYEIYCAPCHGLTGYGNGMVARRGGTPPANYHSDYQLNQPISHYFVVMTQGYRNMYPYNQKITPEDRWAIAAYIRVLQVSQNAGEENVPEDELSRLQQQVESQEAEQGATDESN